MTVPIFRSEMDRWSRDDGVVVIRRPAFARDFPYKPGEHVVFGGPTTRGKTTLAFDLLAEIATPEFPAYVAVSKPSDPVTASRGHQLGFRRVSEWPPPRQLREFLDQKPRGYLVWPRFGDITKDTDRASALTEALLKDRYSAGMSPKSKGGVLMMDDTMIKAKIEGNDRLMTMILAMAGAMKFGMWIFVQRPADSGRTTLWGYENAIHLFFTRGGDKRMLDRYAEIIGEHGQRAKRVIPTLGPYEFLYVHKVDGYLCIVGA